MRFCYLASPYSKYPDGLEEAFQLACRQAALLVAAKIPVFSPMAHFHPIAIVGDLEPRDHDLWLPATRPFMEAASGLIVLQANGWMDSYGMKVEIGTFAAAEKPIVYMTPGEVPDVWGMLVRSGRAA